MNSKSLGVIALLASMICLLCIASCGDSSPSGDPTALEIETLPAGETEGFHPFDEPPVLTSFDAPEYPEEAKQQKLEGSVMVKVIVDADGAVESATVLKSSDPIFEAAALEAASLCQFRPARFEGNPTRSAVAIPYQFRLDS